MKKFFKKIMAGVMTTSLVITLLTGINTTNPTAFAADNTKVALSPWEFYQEGLSKTMNEYGENAGLYGDIQMSSGEILSKEAFSDIEEKTVSASEVSDGFDAEILNNGFKEGADNYSFAPWAVRAEMHNIPMEKAHDYVITFKAHASSRKYAYISLTSQYEGEEVDEIPEIESGDPLIAIGTSDTEYEYKFTNWAGAEALNFTMNLGSFIGAKDPDGGYRSDIITESEIFWNGNVSVSDFRIIDLGVNPNYVDVPPRPPIIPIPTTEETTTEEATTDSNISETITTEEKQTTTVETTNVFETVTTVENPQPTTEEQTEISAIITTNNNESTTVNNTTISDKTNTTAENKTTAKANTDIRNKTVGLKFTPSKRLTSAKVKITFKKLVGAKKYQVAIYKSKNNAKKNKNALVRKSFKKTKGTIKNKKLKSQKKLYLRARAVNGRIYSKWSQVIKIKIKK